MVSLTANDGMVWLVMSKGPGYWLSLCSPHGLAWVRQRSGDDDFASMGVELTTSWAKHLRLERNEQALRTAEPESQIAWKYSNGIINYRGGCWRLKRLILTVYSIFRAIFGLHVRRRPSFRVRTLFAGPSEQQISQRRSCVVRTAQCSLRVRLPSLSLCKPCSQFH